MKFIVLILNIFFRDPKIVISHTSSNVVIHLGVGSRDRGTEKIKIWALNWLEQLRCPVKIWCSLLIEVNINFKTRSHLIAKKILQIFWTKIWEINYISRMSNFKDLMWTFVVMWRAKLQPSCSTHNANKHWGEHKTMQNPTILFSSQFSYTLGVHKAMQNPAILFSS